MRITPTFAFLFVGCASTASGLASGTARAAPVIDRVTATTLTSLVTIAAGEDARFDVLSSADLKDMVALEGDRASLGCDESTASCLAEVAGAMGARLVVFGALGVLGEDLLVTLNLFDSRAGISAGRVVIRGRDAGALADQIPASVQKLLSRIPGTPPADAASAKERLLVLDIKLPDGAVTGAAAAGPAEAAKATSWLVYAGGAGLGVGAIVGAVGGLAAALAAEKDGEAQAEQVQLRRIAHYDERDALTFTALALFGGSAALLAGGGGALIAGLAEGE
jgi:hypothetical protein